MRKYSCTSNKVAATAAESCFLSTVRSVSFIFLCSCQFVSNPYYKIFLKCYTKRNIKTRLNLDRDCTGSDCTDTHTASPVWGRDPLNHHKFPSQFKTVYKHKHTHTHTAVKRKCSSCGVLNPVFAATNITTQTASLIVTLWLQQNISLLLNYIPIGTGHSGG